MLFLSRTIGKAINIGSDITVTVIEIRGRQVVLGVEAPLKVPIYREEIWQRILAERAAAPGEYLRSES